MDGRSQQFLAIMIAIAVLAVLAFIAFFINARVRAAKHPDHQQASGQAVPWHEFILSTVIIVIAAAALVWQFTPHGIGWDIDNRQLLFLIVMLAAGLIALVVFVVALFTGLKPGAVEQAVKPAEAGAGSAETAEHPTGAKPVPVGVRLLGLLVLVVAFLVLNWTALDHDDQYALVTTILYPAAITLSLVLLMDKATRSWAAKTGAENFREWLFCDAIVFLLILAFLNLRQVEEAATYQVLFWDVVQVTLFILVFWLVDRTASSVRFLFAYLYLAALPILLLIWRTLQGLEMPGALSWWESIWPFFFLAVIFFVLELITVVASRETQRHGLSAAKDTLFAILYGLLLLTAIPAAQG